MLLWTIFYSNKINSEMRSKNICLKEKQVRNAYMCSTVGLFWSRDRLMSSVRGKETPNTFTVLKVVTFIINCNRNMIVSHLSDKNIK